MFGSQKDGVQADEAPIRRDWVLVSKKSRREWLVAAAGRVGLNHYQTQRRETAGHMAERIVREALGLLSRQEVDLPVHPKGRPGKVKIAR